MSVYDDSMAEIERIGTLIESQTTHPYPDKDQFSAILSQIIAVLADHETRIAALEGEY